MASVTLSFKTKVFIYIASIIIACTVCFFGGYSLGRFKYNAIDTTASTELIREQNTTIEALRGQLAEAVTGSESAIDTTTGIKDGIDDSIDDIGEVADGLRSDTEGLQSVIDKLEYYRSQGKLLEENNTSE